MKGIWEACDAAKVSIPKEVLDFFDGGPPSDKPGAEIEVKAAIKKWNSKDGSGYEVDLDKLPKGVRFLRCYLS